MEKQVKWSIAWLRSNTMKNKQEEFMGSLNLSVLVFRDMNENLIWRKSIFEKFNYTCVICGKDTKDNVAHHLNGYNWDKENRFNIDNGVCLCSTHHKEFHSIFGYGDNTKEQFKEFKHSKR